MNITKVKLYELKYHGNIADNFPVHIGSYNMLEVGF